MRPGSARGIAGALVAAATLSACRRTAPAASVTNAPRSRYFTITTVPLLVKEERTVFPFLADAFASGGVLEGKEVYAFVPSSMTVMAGDTLHLSFVNPEDDVHAFVLHDLFIPLPPQSRSDTTYVAREPGIFPFSCTVPEHLPMMRGELVVLSP
jgi:plastocyanin